MKKIILVSSLVFLSIMTAVLKASVFVDKPLEDSNMIDNIKPVQDEPLDPKPDESPPEKTAESVSNVTLNMAEISKHNTAGDCWFLISGKVYNVTAFVNLHPGGADKILASCGKDAAQAFQTKGGAGIHSKFAYGLLNNYFIGNFNQTVSLQQLEQSVSDTGSYVPNVSLDDEEEEEEEDEDEEKEDDD